MKKVIAVLMICIIGLSIAACGGEKARAVDSSKEQGSESTKEDIVKTYSFGESIELNNFKFTPKFEGFVSQVANWPNKDYLTPDGKVLEPNPYKADDGNVMMYFTGTIEHIGQSQNLEEFTYDVRIVHNEKNVYEFDLEKMDVNSACATGISFDLESDSWEQNVKKTEFDPLSSYATRYARFVREVPAEVENDDKSLQVVFNINGNEYIYVIR